LPELLGNSAFIVAACAAVLISGVSKAGFGGGVGGLAVPIMSLAISPVQAAAIMLPILVVMDLAGLYFYRSTVDRANLAIIIPGGILGTLAGWALFSSLDEHMIRILVGTISVCFVLWNLASRKPVIATPSRGKGLFWSGVSGLTSFVAHAGGPPLAVYLLAQRLDRAVFVGTNMVFFTLMNALKVLPYFALGLFSAENMKTSMVFAPLALMGILIGVWLNRRLTNQSFFRIANVLLLLSGIKLLYDGIRG
jgi:uncharacterized protein